MISCLFNADVVDFFPEKLHFKAPFGLADAALSFDSFTKDGAKFLSLRML